MNKPATEAVTLEEGGEWISFERLKIDGVPWNPKGRLIHSIRFADGSEWDAVNGWREPDYVPSKGIFYWFKWLAKS